MELHALIGNLVQRLDTGIAGAVVVKFPGGDYAIRIDAAGDVDHTRGAEVSPGELLFARPHQLDGLVGRGGETRRFEGRFPGMLSAVTRARIGNDHAHLAFGNAESLRQLAADTE